MKISAQNLTVGSHMMHTAYGKSEIVKTQDLYSNVGNKPVFIGIRVRVRDRNGIHHDATYAPDRMIEVKED